MPSYANLRNEVLEHPFDRPANSDRKLGCDRRGLHRLACGQHQGRPARANRAAEQPGIAARDTTPSPARQGLGRNKSVPHGANIERFSGEGGCNPIVRIQPLRLFVVVPAFAGTTDKWHGDRILGLDYTLDRGQKFELASVEPTSSLH